jgi:serine phosphatase RsbU (regulator of sigma subunit)
MDQDTSYGTRYIALLRKRSEKGTYMLAAAFTMILGVCYGLWFYNSAVPTGAIFPSVRALVGLLVLLCIWRDIAAVVARHALLLTGLLFPFVNQAMLGGIGPSGLLMFWSMPMLVMAVNVQSGPVRYFYLTLTGTLFVLFAAFDPTIGDAPRAADQMNGLLLSFNIGLVMVLNFVLADLLLRSQRKLRRAIFTIKNESEDRLKRSLAERNDEHLKSLQYASRIQRALMPDTDRLNELFEEVHVHYKPMEAVGGDLLWHGRVGDRSYFVIMDCTGHGVPGGLMSMMMHGLLNEASHAVHKLSVSELMALTLQLLDDRLDRDRTGTMDDADLAALCFDHSKRELTCCSLGCGVLIQQADGMERIDSRRRNSLRNGQDRTLGLTEHRVHVGPETRIHLFTDGILDQFCANDQRRFTLGRLVRILSEAKDRTPGDQMGHLLNAFEEWRGSTEQIDDILMVSLVPARAWYSEAEVSRSEAA